MTFLVAFLWGTGLSLGMCVGLVAWTLVRTKVFERDRSRCLDVYWQSLQALKERNNLTEETNTWLERIADAMESEESKQTWDEEDQQRLLNEWSMMLTEEGEILDVQHSAKCAGEDTTLSPESKATVARLCDERIAAIEKGK